MGVPEVAGAVDRLMLARICKAVGVPEPETLHTALVRLILAHPSGGDDSAHLTELKVPALRELALAAGVAPTRAEQEIDSLEDAELPHPDRHGNVAAAAAEAWLAPRMASAHGNDGLVDLRNSGLGNGGAQVLAGCLVTPTMSYVKSLLLGCCCLGDAAVAAVAAAPSHWACATPTSELHRHAYTTKNLTELDLSNNQFSAAGLRAICSPGFG